jgi:hypothetical protein
MAIAQSISCSIRGAPDCQNTATLAVLAPEAASGNPSLFMAAPPSVAMPLVIGVTNDMNQNMDLYSAGVEGAGGSGYQGYGTLAVGGTSGTPDSTTFTLFIDTHRIGSGINSAPLLTSGAVPRQYSKSATIAVSGASTSVAGDESTSTSLVIESQLASSDSMPLFIDKGFNVSDDLALHISNRIGSGHLPLVLDCTYASNDNIPLFIRTPPSGRMSLYTRGFLE